MKILVISHLYPSTVSNHSGLFVHEQVKALIAKGLDVKVVSPVPCTPFPVNMVTSKWRAYSHIPLYSVREGVQIYYPRYLSLPRAWFFESSGYRMYKGIRDTVRSIHCDFKFDIAHAHVALPDGHAVALLSKELRKPMVITIHGQDLQRTIYRNRACRLAQARAIENSSKIMVVSEKLRALAAEYFDVGDKLCIIPNGINPEQINEALRLQSCDTVENGKILVSVSNLKGSKGIDLNIYAVERLVKKHPKLVYWVIGGGSEEKKLRSLVEEVGLNDHVLFFGHQLHASVLRLMAKGHVFSLPSWNEGFGIAYLEAMAMGKPVIGCQGEGVEDFVENGKTGLLVKPRDIDSIVEAIDFLFSNPRRRNEIGARARNVVKQDFTWDKNAERTLKVYKQVAGGK